jgi:hypothetical protein
MSSVPSVLILALGVKTNNGEDMNQLGQPLFALI